ncbi:AAA family ATPase [Nocardia nova]|uniref:AAA family ATPase n=1 Tax=Nocardia nova TaxID=37330 RepID=UPI0033CCCD97
MAAGGPLLVAVNGGSGVGKSTIILTIAHELTGHYELVLYAALRSADPYTSPSPEDVLADLLVQVGVPWKKLPKPSLRLSVLRAEIAGRRVLLVLDDVDSAAQVLPLLGDLRDAGVIVAGERHLERLRNAGFEPLNLLGFSTEDGVQYLRTVAKSVVAEVDPSVLARLVDVCGGVPWILRAAATRLADRDEPVEEYVRRLELAALQDDVTDDEMSKDLRMDNTSVFEAVCAESYRGLTPDEAWAYRWLSFLPGPDFDLAQAAALLELPLRRVKPLIRELVGRSLIRALEGDRFEYPRVMRKYAVHRAHIEDRSPNPDQLAVRADSWCAVRAVALAKTINLRPIAVSHVDQLFDATEPEHDDDSAVEDSYREFALRWPTFVAAARRAILRGNAADAMTLVLAMWLFGYNTFRVVELIEIYGVLIKAADDPQQEWITFDDAGTRWQFLRDLGGLHERAGELEEAVRWLNRAADVDYPPGRASTLEWLAIIYGEMKQPERGLALLEEAWNAVPLMGDPLQEQRSYSLLRMHRVRFLVALGRGREAEADVVAAQEDFDSRKADEPNTARCRALRGDIAAQCGNDGEARLFWRQASEDFIRLGLSEKAAETYGKLADLAERQGDDLEARRCREEARRLWPEPPSDDPVNPA